MLKEIIDNINESNLEESEKVNLIKVAEIINDNNCPVLLDERHCKLVFQIEKEMKITSYMLDNTMSHVIQKRNGEPREIYKPSLELKEIQRWISKKILENINESKYAHGFVKGRSILTHARNHVHAEPFWVVSFDIKNFFPSINSGKVYNVFRSLGYNQEVSELLSEICTINGSLVQGFPTSPKISNIIMKSADETFKEYCLQENLKFSRYADDISFSGVGESVPHEIFAKLSLLVEATLERIGFRINEKKIKKFANKDPKKITGLMISVNSVKVPSKIKRLLSKEIYYCQKFGVESHLKRTNKITQANYKGYMYGIAGYIRMVENEVGDQYFKELETIYWG